jgi:hypothetical protein
MPTVNLTTAQRDGLYSFVIGEVETDTLRYAAMRRQADVVKDLVARLPACVRLLDQLGWDDDGDQDTYTVEVDSEILTLMDAIIGSVRGAVRDSRDDVDGMLVEEDRIDAECGLRRDESALEAVELIQSTRAVA